MCKNFQLGDLMDLRKKLLAQRKGKSTKRPAKWEGPIPKRFNKMSIHEMQIWMRNQLKDGPPGTPKMGGHEIRWNELKGNIGRRITVESDPPGRIFQREGREKWIRSQGSMSRAATNSLSFDMEKVGKNMALTDKLDDLFGKIYSQYNRQTYGDLSDQEKCQKRWEMGKKLTEIYESEEHLSKDVLFKELEQLARGLEIAGFTIYRYRYDCKLYFLSQDAGDSHPIFTIDKPEFLQYLCEISTGNYSGRSYSELSSMEAQDTRKRFERLLNQCLGDGVFAKIEQKELEKIVKSPYAELVATNGSLTESQAAEMHQYIQQDQLEEE